MGIPLFINARIDTYIVKNDLNREEKLTETIKRGKAYKEAGAGCIYPITLSNKEDIRTIVNEVKSPVNIMLLPGIPDFSELKEIGVARLSLASGFLKVAINAMKQIAEKLLIPEGMKEIQQIPVSSDYLTSLIKK